MADPWYCTREDVKAALDVKETARNNAQVDRAVAAGTKAVERLTLRRFYPWSGTRYFDWPNDSYARSYRLWLDGNEVISASSLVSGGVTIASTDYFLRRCDGVDEPPYTHIEIDLASSAAFAAGDTHQRSIAVTGVFGHSADEEQVGALSAALAAPAGSTASVTWTTARVGVGDILRIDSERIIITERSMVDSTQNLQTPMTSAVNAVTVAVTDGTAFAVDEVLLLDSERMLVVDIAGNNLTVKRGWDGSTPAAHTASDIYTLTGIETARGQLGTTAAAHLDAAPIYRHIVPPLVRDLAIAEAINQLAQEGAGYARSVGSGEGQREAAGIGLADLRKLVEERYGRRARVRAV